MTIRTTRTTISFSQPFKLKDLDDIQPAGDYLLDTDEELIESLSRLAYRRVATLLHLPSTSRPQGLTEVLSVSPAELDAALEKELSGRRPASHVLPHPSDRTTHDQTHLLSWTASKLR